DDLKIRLRGIFTLLHLSVFAVVDVASSPSHLERVRHQAFQAQNRNLCIAILVRGLVLGIGRRDDDEVLTVRSRLWVCLINLSDDKADIFEVLRDVIVGLLTLRSVNAAYK